MNKYIAKLKIAAGALFSLLCVISASAGSCPQLVPASLHGDAAFSRPGVYVVRSGDTLPAVAAKVLGDAERWPEIYRANVSRVERAGELRQGDALVIP